MSLTRSEVGAGARLRSDSIVVLLVEDEPADAELIALRLQAPSPGAAGPIRILAAQSLAEGRALLQLGAPDIIILDLSLPDAQELEALHQIRAATSGVPIVVLTGMADEALALDSLRAGAQDYVLKPPPDGATLRRILRYARERQQLLLEVDLASHASAVAAERWRVLAEIGKVLTASSQAGSAMGQVATLLLPQAGDAVLIYFAGNGAVPSFIEIAHPEAARVAEFRERIRPLLTQATPGADRLFSILDRADSVSSEEMLDATEPLIEALGMSSGTAFPLRVGREVSGLILLATLPGRSEGAGALEFGRSIADRISLELERYGLFEGTQRAIAARDRAFSIVSHDLGDPLSAIQICAAALLDPEPPDLAGMRDMARIIQRSTSLMQQIVEDLRDRANLESGLLALDREPSPVDDLIALMRAMFTPIAQERSLEFVVDQEPGLPSIDADPRRLGQVLSNLLNNAMKFTPAGGRVVLSARRAGGEGLVRFAVSDSGPGIPPEDLAHIFEWFWRSSRGVRTGTGLGLAIAKGLIEAHGSRLLVESVPGEGTTFSFSISRANLE